MIVHNCEQNSYEWFQIKAGIISASNFDKILTPKTLKPSSNDIWAQLACEVICGDNPDPWEGNSHMEHGKDAEEKAVKFYEDETGLECEKVSFITDDAKTMGCSPDRLVGDDGLIEIKSPKAKNMMKSFLEAKETNECPTEYRLQIQGQLMITGREWCDLVLYHPLLGIKVFRVYPDFEIHEKLKDAIEIVNQKRDEAVLIMTGI